MNTQTMRERFEDEMSNIFYSRPQNGAECTKNKETVLAFIEQECSLARTEEAEKCKEYIKKAERELLEKLKDFVKQKGVISRDISHDTKKSQLQKDWHQGNYNAFVDTEIYIISLANSKDITL